MKRAKTLVAVGLLLNSLMGVALAGNASVEGQLPHAAAVIASTKPAVVFVESETADKPNWGSGFFVSSDGYIVTDWHVVDRTQGVTVYYRNAERLPAQVVIEDERLDIAILKVEANREFPTVKLGDSDVDVIDGAEVATIGYPMAPFLNSVGVGLDSRASAGVICAYRLGNTAANRNLNALVQIDAEAPWDSRGSPVFRTDSGAVIGMVTDAGIIAPSKFIPLNLAVPINQVRGLLAEKKIVLKPRLISPDSPEAAMEPGKAEVLNQISPGRHLSPLFARLAGLNVTALPDDRKVAFLKATGYNPPVLSEITAEEGYFYFGAQDGTVRVFKPRRFGLEPAWEFEARHPGFFQPVVSEETLVIASGSLNYDLLPPRKESFGEMVAKAAARAVIGAFVPGGGLLGGLFGGGKKKPKFNLWTEGYVHCLGKDGRLKFELKAQFPSAPAVKGSTAYVGCLGSLFAFDIKSGDIKWVIDGKAERKEISEIQVKKSSSRIWYNVAIGSDNVLYVLKVPVTLEGTPAPVPGAFSDARLEVGGGDIVLSAIDPQSLDPKTNQPMEKWQVKFPKAAKAVAHERPLDTNIQIEERADGQRIIYCYIGEMLFAVSANTQSILWPTIQEAKQAAKEKLKGQKGAVPPPVSEQPPAGKEIRRFSKGFAIGDGRIYIGSERDLVALDASTGQEVGKFTALGRDEVVGSPLLHQGVLYFGTTRRRGGTVYAVDAKTMQLIWRHPTEFPIIDRPVLVEDVLYVSSAALSRDETTHVIAIPLPKR